MIKIIKRSFLLFAIAISPTLLFAQKANDTVEMADILRGNGKIYAVVAVCLTILIGLFIYLFILDRKIKKFEKQQP